MSGRVLVVDDVLTNRRLLEAKLSAAYYNVITASNGEEAINIARKENPDLILLDVMMPVMDGFECCAKIKNDPLLHYTPVIIITSLDQMDARIKGLEAGADDFLIKPPKNIALFARVKNLIRYKMTTDAMLLRSSVSAGMSEYLPSPFEGPNDHAKIVIVDSSDCRASNIRSHVESKLSAKCHIVHNKSQLERFFNATNDHVPDIFIVNKNLNGFDGLRIFSEIRSSPTTRHSCVVMVVEDGDDQAIEKMLDMGVNDYVSSPIEFNELIARIKIQIYRKFYMDQLRNDIHNNHRLATIDMLTEVFSKNYLLQHCKVLMKENQAGSFCVLMIDIDFFKNINDTHGHIYGDDMLKHVSKCILSSVRESDLVARYGGDEFLVILNNSSYDLGVKIAERIRAQVERLETSEDHKISVSIGLAEHSIDRTESVEDIISRADHALYQAKKQGRNQIQYDTENA